MDREQELAHLGKAEQDIADAYRHIEHQRRLITDLRDGGHPTDMAEKLLDSMLMDLQAKQSHRSIILEILGLAPR